MSTITGVVVVHYDEHGEPTFHVFGDERVRLFIVDERAPNDRVYEWLDRRDPADLPALLKDDPIGSRADARHQAIERRILSAMAGKRHLEEVES